MDFRASGKWGINVTIPVKVRTHSGHGIINARLMTQQFCVLVCVQISLITQAHAAGPDPAGSGPVVAALKWLEGTLLGNVATSISVIAVAFIGFLMLTGRMNWRFGATVVVGCFILFGATAIVAGIQTAVGTAH